MGTLLSIKRRSYLEHATAQAKGEGTASSPQIERLLPVNTNPTGIDHRLGYPIFRLPPGSFQPCTFRQAGHANSPPHGSHYVNAVAPCNVSTEANTYTAVQCFSQDKLPPREVRI